MHQINYSKNIIAKIHRLSLPPILKKIGSLFFGSSRDFILKFSKKHRFYPQKFWRNFILGFPRKIAKIITILEHF